MYIIIHTMLLCTNPLMGGGVLPDLQDYRHDQNFYFAH